MIETEALICPKLRVAYVPVPKVACRSIKTALAPIFGVRVIPNIHGSNWERVRELSRVQTMSSYFRFAFVRNPWDRLVSCYYGEPLLIQFPATLAM